MRLFIAILFTKEIKDKLNQEIEELKDFSVKGNFVDYHNLHLTLSFLGELNSDIQAKEAMSRAIMYSGIKEFTITIKGLGKFGRREGDILWAGIEHNEYLYRLQKSLTKELLTLGVKVEDREYKPHLTLARKAIMQEEFSMNEFSIKTPSMSQNVNKISLMKSERINGRSIYTEIFYEKFIGRNNLWGDY